MSLISALISSRADYACVKSVLIHLQKRNQDVLAIVYGGALLDEYGDVRPDLEAHDIPYVDLPTHVQGSRTPGASLGMALTRVEPHLAGSRAVIAVGDRWESLVATVAAYDNIPLIHIQGGETSGNIDDAVRGALTQFAGLHLVANNDADDKVYRTARCGEIEVTGCPSLDLCPHPIPYPSELYSHGAGYSFAAEPYLLVIQHPVTSQWLDATAQLSETYIAVTKMDMAVAWITPNIDAGNDAMQKRIRQWQSKGHNLIRWFHNFSPEQFWAVLANASVIVGNSSAGIRQAPFVGTPAVNIGSRQQGRFRVDSCIDVEHDANRICPAIVQQLERKRSISLLYGDGNAGERCAAHILSWI